jgi:hypothetical protein
MALAICKERSMAMAKVDLTAQAAEMQNLFKPSPAAAQALQESVARFWSTQDQILDAIHEFANGWIERRHEGTRAATQAAQRMCKAETPVDFIREQQEWMNGVIQRLAADGTACQKEWVIITGLALQHVNGAVKEKEAAGPRSTPEAVGRVKAA